MEIWSIVYGDPYITRGGFERAVWCLSKVFVKLGAIAHVIYVEKDPGENIQVSKVVEGINLHGISTSSLCAGQWKFYKQVIQVISKHTTKNADKIFFLHAPFSLPLAKTLKRLRSPVVYHSFGTLIHEFKSSFSEVISACNLRKLLRYMIGLPTERYYLHYVNLIIVPTERAAKEFKETYNIKIDKIIVSPYGHDIHGRFNNSLFYNEVKSFKAGFSGRKILLFIGGEDWDRKGARYALHTFSRLRHKIPSILFMTGTPNKKCISLARKLKIDIGNDVLLPGLVDDWTLAKLYASCDVFVLPSLHEGFALPILEVMAFGKPVVTSPIAAHTISNGVEGFAVNPQNITQFAGAVEKILCDEKLYAEMSIKAKLRSEQFTWDKMGFRLYTLFKSMFYTSK